jgi:acyl carrier protein
MTVPLSRETLQRRVMDLISERVLETGEDFSPTSDLYAAGLDSLAIMQLLLALEEEFEISIPVESVSRKNFSSPDSIVELLAGKLSLESAGKPEVPAGEPAKTPAAGPPPVRISSEPEIFTRQPLKGCDYFVLCFDAMSRRTGQGGHKAHSFLELERLPDVAQLRHMLDRAARDYPMLSAQLRRKWLVGAPEWRPAVKPVAPKLSLYSEKGSEGRLIEQGAEWSEDVRSLMTRIVNTPLPRPGPQAWPKSRFALIEMKGGGATLIFSWSHLLLDGVGAELFLQELNQLAENPSTQRVAQLEPASAIESGVPLAERWRMAQPVVANFNRLAEQRLEGLGPARAQAGDTHFEVHTLSLEQSLAANARCEQIGGGLLNMPFYLACAVRAHDRVLAERGVFPPAYACSVPVQTRRKGGVGPLFQNHVTMFFGSLRREELASLEGAAAILMTQHSRFVKERLGDSLNGLMQAMRMMPPSLYWKFISLQMRGTFASFFHSHTGEFAEGMEDFLGARILNAFHVPGIATPPGTGIFCNEKNGRLVITLCWHEKAMTGAERNLMVDHFLRDLGVA